MKVIDLLNKKANGEKLPSEINCYNQTFYLSDEIYIAENQVGKYFEDYFDFSSLDYEVEIIEDTPKEDKKIEKPILDTYNDVNGSYDIVIINNVKYEISKTERYILGKIGEIIDYIKLKGGE